MAVSLKHTKTSAKSDGTDTSLVQPSDWNAEHTLTQASQTLLGRSSQGTGPTEEITLGTNLALAAGQLQVDLSGYLPLTGGTLTGNVSFTTGGSKRLRAFTSTLPVSQRFHFQDAGIGTPTYFGIISSGTGTEAGVQIYNQGNPDNAAYLQVYANSAKTSILSSNNGVGASLPFTIDVNNSEALRITTGKRFGFNNEFPEATIDVFGSHCQGVALVGSDNIITCTSSNFFSKTVTANATFTFSSVPANRGYAFVFEVVHTSGTITWPTSVRWPGDTAPTLTTGKTHLFMFMTDDTGARWRGAYLVNYTT